MSSGPSPSGRPPSRLPNNPELERAGPRNTRSDESGSEPARGLSLTLLYSLVVLALCSAILIALFIVLPFYHRR